MLLGFSQDVGDIATGALIIAAGTIGCWCAAPRRAAVGTLG